MKKGASILMAIILSVTAVAVVKADELSEAQKKLNNINDSLSDKKDELNNINKQRQDTQKILNDLDSKMQASADELNQLSGKASGLNNQVAELEKQIELSKESLQSRNEIFKKRLRAMYIEGNEGYLGLILNSSSLSDFINRVDLLRKVVEYDTKLIKSIEDNKNTLEDKKLELQGVKKETDSLKQQTDEKLKELQASSDSKTSLMASLEKDKAAYEKMIQEEENQSKVIADMVKKIQQQKKSTGKSSSGSTTAKTGGTSAIGKLYCVTGAPTYKTSEYGWRFHPVLKTKRFHAGIDLGVWTGTKIYSLADGVVIYSGWMSGYGNVVMIDHGSLTSVYGHNSSLVVKTGQTVKGGQLISYSGNTGVSSGPHLHFEMRKESGETIDPNPYYVK